jgi:hypothetical protein
MVVENVRGAIPWVGRSKANFGSYHLWGDVAMVGNRIVADVGVPEFGQMALAAPGKGAKQPGRNFHFPEKYGIPSPRFSGAEHEPGVQEAMALKNGDRYPGQPGNPVNRVKQHGSGAEWSDTGITKHSSRSSARKHASALIAKIPEPLSRHIGRIFHPGG